MLSRVSWAAVASLLFVVLAIISAVLEEPMLAQTFALGAITWAILSLKERT